MSFVGHTHGGKIMVLLTTEDMDHDDSSPFSAVTGSKMRTAIASMPADKGA